MGNPITVDVCGTVRAEVISTVFTCEYRCLQPFGRLCGLLGTAAGPGTQRGWVILDYEGLKQERKKVSHLDRLPLHERVAVSENPGPSVGG